MHMCGGTLLAGEQGRRHLAFGARACCIPLSADKRGSLSRGCVSTRWPSKRDCERCNNNDICFEGPVGKRILQNKIKNHTINQTGVADDGKELHEHTNNAFSISRVGKFGKYRFYKLLLSLRTPSVNLPIIWAKVVFQDVETNSGSLLTSRHNQRSRSTSTHVAALSLANSFIIFILIIMMTILR